MRKDSASIAIIGPGRIGQALGRLLAEYGASIAYVAARDLAAARRAVRFIGQGEPVGLADPRLQQASIVLLTTSDSALDRIAKDLAQRGSGRKAWQGKTVLHTCGSVSSAVLRPLKRRGAAIGSLHPYQTVPSPRAGVRGLFRCYWGIEGDPRAVRLARHWVRLLDGIPFAVRPRGKTLYHLSAFLVCPTVVTLMEQSSQLLGKAGIPSRTVVPMLRQFVAETANNFAELGARRALTGPAVRGDWATIARHRSALQRTAPEIVPVYEALLQAMLRLAGQKVPK